MSKDLGDILRDYWSRKEHDASAAANLIKEQQKRIEELEAANQALESDVNQWLFALAETQDQVNELEADKNYWKSAHLVDLRVADAELEDAEAEIEELTGQLAEWQDRMKHFLTLSEQQINYLMEEREQDIEQIAKLTVAADQVYKFLNEICSVGGAYGYHQGALVGDARQLMAQLKAAKAS